MQTIYLHTRIAAPIERCFLLSTSIDLHVKSTAHTSERAIAGVTHGLIGAGESVTWRGRHFGLMLTHESRITAWNPPQSFRDEMVRGHFRSFVHDHRFVEQGDVTLMIDQLDFESPLKPIGTLIDMFVLKRYLTKFLKDRNRILQRVAEQNEWRQYLV